MWLSLTRRAALVCVAHLVFSGQLSATEVAQDTAANTATNHRVYIEDMQFSPAKLQVRFGDTITWINNDFIPHTATAVDKSWNSKNLAKGEEFSLIVSDNTVLDYYCFYHPNMIAKIEILN